jgi:hypothetical protein
MKITGFLFVALLSMMAGCRENYKEKIASLYKANRKKLESERVVNKFVIRLAYIPASVLPHDRRTDTTPHRPVQQDTANYYFKLQVTSNDEDVTGNTNKTALYFGLDGLFATAEAEPSAKPKMIEPVITGNRKRFEYLLAFSKKDFEAGAPVKVVFFDRLFTNTRQVFVFDRKKIDEIETLQYYANEA